MQHSLIGMQYLAIIGSNAELNLRKQEIRIDFPILYDCMNLKILLFEVKL